MEEVTRIGPRLEDVVDLVHRIQSLLPLSKSWLQAWSTIPTLRFYKPKRLVSEVEETDRMNLIDRTMLRYYQDNIPIETLDLELTITDQKLASLANKWIQTVATQRCLKKLYIKIYNSKFKPPSYEISKFLLPDEIFSGENLYAITVRVDNPMMIGTVLMTSNRVINCVPLRVLELFHVTISEKVLDSLFSTCTLLEKINLTNCIGSMKIKVKNLRYLQNLTINSRELQGILQIDDFPSINSVINCVSLKVLQLVRVKISGDVLDSLLSTCTLLEKLDLSHCIGLTRIKVKNLHYLQEFLLVPDSKEKYEVLEVDDVPNLRVFWYLSWYTAHWIPRTFNIDSLSKVTELVLNDVIMDVVISDMINSKLPVLESLSLEISTWSLNKLNISSESLKVLTLYLHVNWRFYVQVYAPKLLHLCYVSATIPKLLFPNHNTTGNVHLRSILGEPMDFHFLYKMNEVHEFLNKFDTEIIYDRYYNVDVPLVMDIDDLKRRFPFPAINVHRLVFDTSLHGVWVDPSYFDALFTICHPNYIKTYYISSLLSELIISGLMKKKELDLESIEFNNPRNKNWEIVTDSCTGILDMLGGLLEFRQNWRSSYRLLSF